MGAFVIFNTLSITVAQRTRELATLRTIGASRRQVLTSVLVEALTIGVLASIVGLFSGFLLAKGLKALFSALDLDLPSTGLRFTTGTVVAALLVGVLVTLVAGLAPAIRATRVPPISAVREGATLPRGRFARWPYLAVVSSVGSPSSCCYSLFANELGIAERLLSIGGGVLLLFIGVALSPRLVRPLADAVSPVGTVMVAVFSVLFYPILISYWLLRYGMFERRAGDPEADRRVPARDAADPVPPPALHRAPHVGRLEARLVPPRVAGRAARRDRRQVVARSRPRERAAQPAAHGLDGLGADDRARARHTRRGARRRASARRS